MIELPEAIVLARQIDAALSGKRILNVTFAHTPHKLAWYYGNTQDYQSF